MIVAVADITLIEMVYLIEKGRISAESFTRLAIAIEDSQSVFASQPVNLPIARMLTRIDKQQIPNMPDRIIAATALLYNVPVISRDGQIKLSNIKTIW